jgi:hypothetical protein
MSSGPDYSSTNLSELVSLTEPKMSIHLRKLLSTWEFLQIWFADSRFSKYSSRDFGIWTESYGGHYGPTFAACVL